MFVHTIKTSFFRKRKPADYEGCDVSAELTATLTEGEDFRQALRTLADEAAIVVYTRIGMPTFATPVFAGLKAETVVDNGTATQIVTEATPPAPAADVKKADGRGRPAMTEAEKAEAKAKREAEKAAAEAAKTAGKPAAERGQIATNPENRIDPATGIPEETPAKTTAPAATASNIPDETPAPKAAATPAPAGDTLTDAELQNYVQEVVVVQKKLTPIRMKQIFKAVSGVERMQEMKDGAMRLKVKQAIEAEVGGGDLMKDL